MIHVGLSFLFTGMRARGRRSKQPEVIAFMILTVRHVKESKHYYARLSSILFNKMPSFANCEGWVITSLNNNFSTFTHMFTTFV